MHISSLFYSKYVYFLPEHTLLPFCPTITWSPTLKYRFHRSFRLHAIARPDSFLDMPPVEDFDSTPLHLEGPPASALVLLESGLPGPAALVSALGVVAQAALRPGCAALKHGRDAEAAASQPRQVNKASHRPTNVTSTQTLYVTAKGKRVLSGLQIHVHNLKKR
jgi:hypothetical protein